MGALKQCTTNLTGLIEKGLFVNTFQSTELPGHWSRSCPVLVKLFRNEKSTSREMCQSARGSGCLHVKTTDIVVSAASH